MSKDPRVTELQISTQCRDCIYLKQGCKENKPESQPCLGKRIK